MIYTCRLVCMEPTPAQALQRLNRTSASEGRGDGTDLWTLSNHHSLVSIIVIQTYPNVSNCLTVARICKKPEDFQYFQWCAPCNKRNCFRIFVSGRFSFRMPQVMVLQRLHQERSCSAVAGASCFQSFLYSFTVHHLVKSSLIGGQYETHSSRPSARQLSATACWQSQKRFSKDCKGVCVCASMHE